MSVRKKIRFEVFKRDKFTCQYCGRSAPDVVLQVDHIKPMSKGGGDDILNLATSCFDCNSGKSNRTLDNDSVIKAQKRQLDELQQRREQLEMMLKWQRSLIDIDQQVVTELAEFWSDFVEGYSLNEMGLKNLKQWVRRFGVNEVIEAIKASCCQYLKYDDKEERHTQESVDKAFNYIPRICKSERQQKERPYLKDLYYIRAIVRNRCSYCIEWECLQMLEAAYLHGITVNALKVVALSTYTWSDWESAMQVLIQSEFRFVIDRFSADLQSRCSPLLLPILRLP